MPHLCRSCDVTHPTCSSCASNGVWPRVSGECRHCFRSTVNSIRGEALDRAYFATIRRTALVCYPHPRHYRGYRSRRDTAQL